MILAELIIRLVNVVLLTAAVAWLASAPDWEPFIAVIGLLASMITLELREYHSRKAEAATAADRERKRFRKVSSSDRSVFEKYVEHFGGEAYKFLREHDMGAPFHYSAARPFHGYRDCWKGPNFEFVDREIEEARALLHQALLAFTESMIQNTYGDGEFNTMGLKDMETDPEVLQIRDEMNALGHKAADAFEAFVRLGRARMKEDES